MRSQPETGTRPSFVLLINDPKGLRIGEFSSFEAILPLDISRVLFVAHLDIDPLISES